jgi:Flp pilus assembly protein TadD
MSHFSSAGRWFSRKCRYWALVLLILVVAIKAPGQSQLVPESITLDESVAKAIDAEWLTDEERSAMRVFHGVWDWRDLTTPQLQAEIALNAWDFSNPVFENQSVPAELRAECQLRSGELQKALEILHGAPASNRAARIAAEAHEGLGQNEHAARAIEAPAKGLLERQITDAAELTEGVRALYIRSRLQGQPARDFQSMMNLLAKAHQELDRWYWPAKLVEAQLLLDKDNPREGIGALFETLSLNPRCSEAWYLLGRAAIERFDFDGATAAANALRRINRRHPLADLLIAESQLVQDDPAAAQQILEPLLKRWPKLRQALAFNAAAAAISYDEHALKMALNRYDELSPGSGQAYYLAGRQLSMNRQYALAAQLLEEAIRRQPAWPAPQIELGLMELQSGRDDRALQVLKNVARLDQFNKRAANSLHLLEELTKYSQIESEHFIVRYPPGPDQVFAELLPPQLEKIHATVAGRFGYEPPQKTLIEVHPNHERFAVRITGMPFVHTIAACTGPVIALEVPREGPPRLHQGLFDWPRVIQHEYTHTITLGQTRNRIPHWLTEAAAVSMEPAPRGYETCKLLANAYHKEGVFRLEEMKWAFVRPKHPSDRAKAYAIGHWIVEFMNERFGDSALVRLLQHYFEGEREQQAIPNALGVSRERFYTDFLAWAGTQVKAWGLDARPAMRELEDELRAADPDMALVMAASQKARLDAIAKALAEQIGKPSGGGQAPITAERWPPLVRPPIEITDEQLQQWLVKYPDHPDLLEMQIRRRIDSDEQAHELNSDNDELIALLERYAALRPVDPFPHKKLAQIWLASATPQRAIEYLEFLDVREEKSPVYAIQLAKLYRQTGELEKAFAKAMRAVNINPYSAPNRELAAAIAIELKDLAAARQHIVALTILEPDRPQHPKRLKAVEAMMNR